MYLKNMTEEALKAYDRFGTGNQLRENIIYKKGGRKKFQRGNNINNV